MADRVHAIFKVRAEGRTRLVVLDTQDLSFGRSSDNDLSIDDPELSREHAVFRRTPEGCRVEDMGTSNGTEVNGESVDHAILSHGSVVRVGGVEITYGETTRNPASLGRDVEWASQLKGFGGNLATADGEATMLGLMEPVADDAPFEVRPAGDFDPGELDAAPAPTRDLDAELASLDLDPVDDPDAESTARPLRSDAGAEAETTVWELDDPAGGAEPDAVALTLEIEGLRGELRRLVEGLAGKVLELPSLRVRIKGDDLD